MVALRRSIALAAVLVFAVGMLFLPRFAFADDALSAAQPAGEAANDELTAQAGSSMVSIPVIVKVKNTHWGRTHSAMVVKYNESGQIKGYFEKSLDSSYPWLATTNFYFNSKGGLTYSKHVGNEGYVDYAYYKLDSKNRVTSIKDTPYSYKYDASGRVLKVTLPKSWDGNARANLFTWSNDGLLTKAVNKNGDETTTLTFGFDENGNFKTCSMKLSYDPSSKYTSTLKNKYKDGLLKRRIERNKNKDVMNDTTYTYKTIQVPQSFADQVLAQQKWLKMANQNYFDIMPPLESMYK